MAIQNQSPVKMKSSITITKISKSSTATAKQSCIADKNSSSSKVVVNYSSNNSGSRNIVSSSSSSNIVSSGSSSNIGSILDKCDKFNLDDRAKFPSLNMTMDEKVNINSMTNKQQNISSLKKYKILSKQVFMAIRCIFKNVHKKEEHHLIMDKQYCEKHFSGKFSNLINFYKYLIIFLLNRLYYSRICNKVFFKQLLHDICSATS